MLLASIKNFAIHNKWVKVCLKLCMNITLQAAAGSCDLILNTVSVNHELSHYIPLLVGTCTAPKIHYLPSPSSGAYQLLCCRPCGEPSSWSGRPWTSMLSVGSPSCTGTSPFPSVTTWVSIRQTVLIQKLKKKSHLTHV